LNQKIQTGSFFLGLRWLDTALDFPIDALYSHPKLRQAGALQDTLTATKRLGLLLHLGDPQPSAPSRLRVSPSARPPSGVQPMSSGLSPDTSAAAFAPKSTFAFNLQVKPGTFQNPIHGPIGSASVDFQPFFICGLQD
jgi:hypothetical protein